jgi:2-polyprenyl-3-methyl-5-hydroxy-6-metoxy-1,4-benzoquinol methylase
MRKMWESKRGTLKASIQRFIYPLPTKLARKQIPDTAARLREVRGALEKHYFVGWRAKDACIPQSYGWDLNNHLIGRIRLDRQRIVPWLEANLPLENSSILEIGCGTGSSTVALAEQGARVTAIDLDADAIEVARCRCDVYRVSVDLRLANAVDALKSMTVGSYDLIILLGCLEHMTHVERIACLRMAWELLPKNGTLAIVETPNRLWHFDSHTSLLPFFNWLPDDLAFEYSRFSNRKDFNDLYRDNTVQKREHFLRRGRGASFHEFHVAIGSVADLNVHSLKEFQRPWSELKRSKTERDYRRILQRHYPELHGGWFEEYLDLAIKR